MSQIWCKCISNESYRLILKFNLNVKKYHTKVTVVVKNQNKIYTSNVRDNMRQVEIKRGKKDMYLSNFKTAQNLCQSQSVAGIIYFPTLDRNLRI